jgi:hypothetical protein
VAQVKRKPLAGKYGGDGMTKSTWIEIIKAHTEPIEQGAFYSVKEKGGRKGYIEILVRDARQEVDRGSSYAGLRGERVRLDSDDVLVLFNHKQWDDGEMDVISYVLWQDIRSIRFIWP